MLSVILFYVIILHSVLKLRVYIYWEIYFQGNVRTDNNKMYLKIAFVPVVN